MNELDELVNDRTLKVELMKKDGDKSHKLLAQLYGSPTHFITELLQNSEDEGAKNVTFKLGRNELVFSHDAKKLFDFNDIRAVSNFGDNEEKKEKPNTIGRFGIGFKSVYSITDKPRIVSAGFDITIRDYNIPGRTNEVEPKFFQGTKIILPFKDDIKERIYDILSAELQDLNLQYLLFLSSISSIKWETENSSGFYERVINNKDNRFITLKSATKEVKYFLLEKGTHIENKKLSIKISFQLADTEKRAIVPCSKSPLFVFFPTKIETNLKFLVHAPFYTTPARENIQEDDSLITIEADHRNEKLKTELGKLLVEGLAVFKNLRLLNVDFLNILPIDEDSCDRSAIYKELYEAIKNEIKSNKQLIPNANGGFSAANDIMLLGSADLANLLNSKQAKKLFGRSFWTDKKITVDKTKTLRDYLFHIIGIPEHDLTSFANKIDAGFLLEQPDNWLIQFYKTIHKASALWRAGTRLPSNAILRTKPIIRIEGKQGIKQIEPFQHNGKPKVFLPTKENTNYETVKQNIAKNKEARKFLEDLGLTSPDLFAEINEFIIPKLKKGQVYLDYFDDFKKIIEAFQTGNQEKRNSLIHDLRECAFIIGFNIETGETKFLRFDEVYFQDADLEIYFASNSKAFFVATDQYSLAAKEIIKFQALLKEVGIREYPNRLPVKARLSWEDKRNLRGNGGCTQEYYCNDYQLHGLTMFLEQEITLEKSISLWHLVVKAYSNKSNTFFQGEYAYRYYSDYNKNFSAFFLVQLRQNAWLVIDGKRYRPNEIAYSFLPGVYKENGFDFPALGSILGFKPDEIKAIEERFGGKFLTGEELKKFEQWKAEQIQKAGLNKIDIDEELDFSPEYKPAEANLNSRELTESEITIDFNQEQEGNNNTNTDDEEVELPGEDDNTNVNDEAGNEIADRQNQKLLKDIGDWGQTYVNLDLEREFGPDESIKIIDLNEIGNRGVGCDFIVKRNDEIIRLVEVKTTVEKFGQSLYVSGTQWEIARNYFRVNDGDKYWIYCVFNAGKEDAEIVKVKNPVQKWKEGKIFAHPVNFIIK